MGLSAGQSVLFDLTGPVKRQLAVDVVDGRAKVVDPAALDGSGPTVRLSLPSNAFTRLACGRVDPATVLDGSSTHGGVEIAGDEELGRRTVDNLAFTI